MLAPFAIEEFLERELDSHVWIKDLTSRQLDDALYEQDFRAASSKPLRKHQKACILLGLAYPQFSFWLDMGTGKTRIILELLNHYWRKGLLRRALVLAISDEAVAGWEEQIAKWNIKVPYVGVGNSSTAEKWQAVAELGAGIIIATYPSFNWMFAEKLKVKKKGKKPKIEMKPNKDRIDKFADNLDAFIPDESVHLGNHQSLGFKIAKRLSARCTFRYPLAGVPFGKDPTLVWSQQYLTDRGESLGDTLGIFRGALFNEKPGYFGGFEYKFREDMRPALADMMGHRSIAYSVDECLDLPPVTNILRKVNLPKDADAYYEQALKAIRLARGDRVQINNIFLRMRQMSSGFIGYKDDETGEKASLVFPSNPKLDDLLDQIEDMPDQRKFIIFHEFTITGRMLVEGLKKRGFRAGWLWSGEKNRRDVVKRFDNDSPQKMKGLVCNWRVAAESMNFQTANYLHEFESPVGVIPRKQSERRCFRDGQERAGFLFDYVATPTDQRILDFHATGDDLMAALLRDPMKALATR